MAKVTIDYSRELNSAQYQAVTAGDGPMLVVAGAGSGKTRTLVYRVAWLVEHGVVPESILLLTFTRRAAGEMITRATSMLDHRCQRVVGGTFHWLANRILHRYSRRLSLHPDFTIIDRGDAEDILNFLAADLGFRERHQRFPKKRTIAEIFSKTVNRTEPLEVVLVRDYDQFLKYQSELAELWERYRSYKRQHHVMDFDDLLVYLNLLLQEHKDVCRELASQYLHILVDEYQDTNRIQADIVRALATSHGNVMVVGDDSQSIYSFRGAHFRNILDFPKLFPDARVFKLEENYRSPQPILDLANGIIASAREKYTKCLFTRRSEGPRPLLVRPVDETTQSEFICSKVKELQLRGVPLREVAVLFRASFHSFDLEVALNRVGIRFVKYGGFKFIESAHVKDMLAHLRAWQNPWDRISWTRLLLLINQVGPKRSQEILTYLGEGEPSTSRLALYARSLPMNHGLHRLVGLFEELSTPGLSVSQKISVVRSYYEPILMAKYDDHPKRLQELKYLQDWTVKYDKLEEFLADIALEPPNANVPEQHPQMAEDHLVLSTIHSAKGLEWQAVFLLSAVEGRLPSGYGYSDEEILEEERRLLYVAVTRAKESLFLCCPQRIYDRKTGFRNTPLSMFLRQLPSGNYFHHADEVGLDRSSPVDDEDSGETEFSPGDAVRHPFFGRGLVVSVPDNLKVRIRFEDGHTRLLHLEYAPLERVATVY
ncbi:MAG: ATP-dependent helicase [Deltaproteobacteria bacterium]|nr:MAG: ATP-dependent helicase [Deltaproteobacteria bacterium]